MEVMGNGPAGFTFPVSTSLYALGGPAPPGMFVYGGRLASLPEAATEHRHHVKVAAHVGIWFLRRLSDSQRRMGWGVQGSDLGSQQLPYT